MRFTYTPPRDLADSSSIQDAQQARTLLFGEHQGTNTTKLDFGRLEFRSHTGLIMAALSSNDAPKVEYAGGKTVRDGTNLKPQCGCWYWGI